VALLQIVSVKTLTGPRASGEVCHITLQTDGRIPFVEGQSYGIIPPVGAKPRVGASQCWRECKNSVHSKTWATTTLLGKYQATQNTATAANR